MFRRALVALRHAGEASTVVQFLERLGVQDITLAVLDFSGIPVDSHIVVFKRAEEPEPIRTSVKISFTQIKYSGDKLPAEAFVETAVDEGCEVVVVTSTPSEKPVAVNLAATITAISVLPVLVIPVEAHGSVQA